jgi:hypothetical protein
VKLRLCLISATAAAIIAAVIAHGLTASSALWYPRTPMVIMTAALAAGSVVALFRESGDD